MTNIITKEGLKDLKAELSEIEKNLLPANLESINRALAEGDLRENAALDSAKLERDKFVARINEIQEVLGDYELISDVVKDTKLVRIGGSVKVQYTQDNSTFDFKIVGSSEADAIGGKISNESPLAQSILGKKPGDVVSFKIKDNTISVKILEILA
jgi:transcription elongation factor GreA